MSHSYCAHGIDVENYHCLKCPPAPIDKLLDVLADHIATLEEAGLGGAAHVDYRDVTHAAADHFEKLRDALAAVERPKHGDPLGGKTHSHHHRPMSGERWHVEPDHDGNHIVIDENGLTIATVWGPEDDSNSERKDALLLAAAPELFEALDRLVALVDVVAEDFSDSAGIIRTDHAAVLNARAALAKAALP